MSKAKIDETMMNARNAKKAAAKKTTKNGNALLEAEHKGKTVKVTVPANDSKQETPKAAEKTERVLKYDIETPLKLTPIRQQFVEGVIAAGLGKNDTITRQQMFEVMSAVKVAQPWWLCDHAQVGRGVYTNPVTLLSDDDKKRLMKAPGTSKAPEKKAEAKKETPVAEIADAFLKGAKNVKKAKAALTKDLKARAESLTGKKAEKPTKRK